MRASATSFGESPLTGRSRMAMPLARLTLSSDPAGHPIRRALRAAVRGRASPEERVWVERIESRRSQLISSADPTGMPEFESRADGAGGIFTVSPAETTLGFASAVMSLPPHWCLLLMRLIRELSPQSCLELGSGFGISTAYQAAALDLNGTGSLTTLEGSPTWAGLAAEGVASLGLENVTCRVGPIAETLPEEAERCAPVDFVFIDAEHQHRPTIEHFETLLPSLAGGAVVVFDDADWPQVQAAHTEIGRHARVVLSLAIGRLGLSVIGPDPDSA